MELSESASFCKRYGTNILVSFSVRSCNCRLLAKREFWVSQGSDAV